MVENISIVRSNLLIFYLMRTVRLKINIFLSELYEIIHFKNLSNQEII